MNVINPTSIGISTPVEKSNPIIPTEEVPQQKVHDLKLPPQTDPDKVEKTSLHERVSFVETAVEQEFKVFQEKITELASNQGMSKKEVEIALKVLEKNLRKVIEHVRKDTTTVPQLSPDLEGKLKIMEEHIGNVDKFFQEKLEEKQLEEDWVMIGVEKIKGVDTESKQTINKLDEISQSLRAHAKELGGNPDKIRDISKGPSLPGLNRETTYTYLYTKIVEKNRPQFFWKIMSSIFKVPTKALKESHYDYCHRHINMLKQFVCHRIEILEDLRENSEKVLKQKAGFVVHLRQNPKEVAIKGFEDYPDLFIQEYEKARKGGYLVEFFQKAIGGACFPSRSRTLEDFAIRHNVEIGEVRACTENSLIVDILNEEARICSENYGKEFNFKKFEGHLKQLWGMKDESTYEQKGMDGGVKKEITTKMLEDYWRAIYGLDEDEPLE